jgi:ubiquitin carboxyl-terminal hydrolase 7
MEVISYKIFNIQREDMMLDNLNTAGTKSYRVEEIPKDELNLASDEMLVPVAHYHKEIFATFGVPFLMRIKNKETYGQVRHRLLAKLDIPEKEFDRIKMAVIIMGRQKSISDDPEETVRIEDYQATNHQGAMSTGMQTRPWLGLDHINKAPKNTRYPNYQEKAIKIHN